MSEQQHKQQQGEVHSEQQHAQGRDQDAAAAAAAAEDPAALPITHASQPLPPLQQCSQLGFLAALPRKREAIRQFTPSWYTVAMGTGSVCVSIAGFPFHFPGQLEVAWAVWWLTSLLFVAFSCALLARTLCYPRAMVLMLHHPTMSLFLGTIPMSFSTLINGIVAIWVPRYGPAAAHVAHALFWVNLPAVLLCIVLIPFSMFTADESEHAMHTMTAVWLLPVVPACVAANSAGVVSAALPDVPVAVAVGVLGVALLGIGFLLSFQICGMYYTRLCTAKMPAKEVIVSSFLPVGPMAMTAWALLNLALAARHHLPLYLKGTHLPEGVSAADVHMMVHGLVAAACVLSVFLWGFATWWLLLAISSTAATACKSGVPFNLGYWAAIFPVGVYAGATCLLGKTMAGYSRSFDVLGAIAVCCHVLLWLVVVAFTAKGAWTGELFHAPCLAGAPKGAARTPATAAAAAEVESRLQRAA